MRIGIVGAGFAGLAAAKVLRACGHEVLVVERAPDVGGVWSATRRYPGLRTQNNKDTYRFSDHPMPAGYPEWPSSEQVQTYLQSYVERFGLGDSLALSTDLRHAAQRADGWDLELAGAHDTVAVEAVDHLVVANGIFCDPFVPRFPGADAFTAAGGRVCHTCELHDVAEAAGRHVLVVGYGKSSCDMADAVADVAASTHVVARELLWKMPRRLGGLNYKYLLLTRLGEALFPYAELRGLEAFLHGRLGDPVRRGLLAGVQAGVTAQLRLRGLGLVPYGSFQDIARSTVSLATDGLYGKVRAGSIVVHRDREIAELSADGGRPVATLSDGSRLDADLVLCGTGFHQRVPFLADDVRDALGDGRGNFRLYHQILPPDVPRLTFCGYNSSFFSPLSAEVAAQWIALHLAGEISLPDAGAMRRQVDARLAWMERRTEGRHARGTNVIPFSMHNVDEMLSDIGDDVSRGDRVRQWLAPVDPGAYAAVGERVLARARVHA